VAPEQEFPISDPPPTPEEQQRIDRLTPQAVARIDQVLADRTSDRWQKMARIVALTMTEVDAEYPDIPYSHFADRLRVMVHAGALEYRGRLDTMRFCELRRKAS
jgi:hypothetical protein